MKPIAIIGLGWLGMPLAEQLAERGWCVKGTKRQTAEHSQIEIFPFELSEDVALNENLLAVDAVVINIPPKNTDYSEGIKRLVSEIILQKVPQLIFVSSTGVYPQRSGQFDEQSPTDENNALAQLEQWLLAQPIDCDILRLGGLIGANRHPVRHLAGKTHLAGANQPVNLVHQADCIRAIELLLKTPNGKRLFNLVAPQHPTRQAYYGKMAKQLGLPKLQFTADNAPLVRIVSGEKICRELGFEYRQDIWC